MPCCVLKKCDNNTRNSKKRKIQRMDVIRQLQKISWSKPHWSFPSMSKENNELLKQCVNLPRIELSTDIEEIIRKSKAFPVPFPIESVRSEKLKVRRPVDKLLCNAVATYPILHERVLQLMTHFLVYKRKYGSSIEKALYKDMSVPDLIDRILKKRAVTFMGPHDTYKLLSGVKGRDGWESIGTVSEKPPLVLKNCLSYDEMKLAAMLYVSGPTECINDGARRNQGVVNENNIEKNAIIIGIIGPRLKRRNRMEYEDMLITEDQNSSENGYGEEATVNDQAARHMWRQMWADFYQVSSNTYEELKSSANINKRQSENDRYTDRYVLVKNAVFDNEVFYKRLYVTAECVLLESEERARQAGRSAFVYVVGAGLGVWKYSGHQTDVFVLTFLERIRSFLKRDLLDHVTDVNLAYIKASKGIVALFKKSPNSEGTSTPKKRIFLESKSHPKGGINVLLENSEPSAKLTGEHEGKLLVITYPWDGNAHPGNEFWIGKLSSSGDPAAACSTQVAELHNAHINPAVCGLNARVAGRGGLGTLSHYCSALNT